MALVNDLSKLTDPATVRMPPAQICNVSTNSSPWWNSVFGERDTYAAQRDVDWVDAMAAAIERRRSYVSPMTRQSL